ncbi:MAG: RnfABCDGE type electron transport complex subunit D [Clostridia bacterium]|nr:RnfABCDGE type electron transport complex subunit D [Clostridia bacterium]
MKLQISSSPHILTKKTTRNIMIDVVISLLPAAAAGIVWFGWSAVWVILATVTAAVTSEWLFNMIVRKKSTSLEDCSAVVTGLLLALNLPANVPIWQAVVGAVFAIIVVKCFFGGLGRNIVNPAITARVFMLVSFGSMATAAFPVDSTASATPLVELAGGKTPELLDLFIGNHGGAIGETCVLALLLGAIYLFARQIISWHIPVAFIGTVFLFTWAVVGDATLALAWCLSGGLFLGAIFMATDYVTAPETGWGKLIFGIGAGVITVLIRFWGNYPEGVSFAILLMNILNPFIDSWTARKPFGGEKK